MGRFGDCTKTSMRAYDISRKPLKSLRWGIRLWWAAKVSIGRERPQSPEHHKWDWRRERESRTMMIGRHKLAFQVRISPASPFFFSEKGIVWLFINPNLKIKRTACVLERVCAEMPPFQTLPLYISFWPGAGNSVMGHLIVNIVGMCLSLRKSSLCAWQDSKITFESSSSWGIRRHS